MSKVNTSIGVTTVPRSLDGKWRTSGTSCALPGNEPRNPNKLRFRKPLAPSLGLFGGRNLHILISAGSKADARGP
jgi:hypothetical protein